VTDTGIYVSLDDEEEFRSRVVLDYTNRDFTAIRNQLVGLAGGLMPEWTTVGETSDFGTLLLELFAYMGDVVHYYIDRTASEAFLGTAIRRQSVMYIADMLGYRPMGQSAASVELTFMIDANAVEAETIPIGARIYNNADTAEGLLVFELDEAVTLDPITLDPTTAKPVLEVKAFATEGITVKDALLGVSLGIPNAEFLLPHKGVVYNTVSITSDEAGQTLPWSFISDISLARPTQAAFTTYLDDLDNTHIVFGDNAAGRIAPVQARFFVTYRYGVGAKANDLVPSDLNIAASSVPSDVDLSFISVKNTASPIGGTDPESVDAMRFSIPRAAVRIKSRAVTLNDYADLALQVPGVAKSVATGTTYTAVTIRIAPQDDKGTDTYMAYLCDAVEDYMKDKVMLGSTVYAEPGTVNELHTNANVHIRLLVHVVDGYNRSAVRLQVEKIVRDALDFNVVDFGTRVSIGKVYRAALAVAGVEWVELQWLSTTEPTLLQDKQMAPTTGNTPIALTVGNIDIDPLMIPRINPPMTLTNSVVTNKVLNANIATLTTAVAHKLVVGNIVDVAGVDTTFNGRYTVKAPLTTVTFSYDKVAVNVAAVTATGTVTQVDQHMPEKDTDFPGIAIDELSHDGLWVWATGGVVGS
jgi:hypothetical protein